MSCFFGFYPENKPLQVYCYLLWWWPWCTFHLIIHITYAEHAPFLGIFFTSLFQITGRGREDGKHTGLYMQPVQNTAAPCQFVYPAASDKPAANLLSNTILGQLLKLHFNTQLGPSSIFQSEAQNEPYAFIFKPTTIFQKWIKIYLPQPRGRICSLWSSVQDWSILKINWP